MRIAEATDDEQGGRKDQIHQEQRRARGICGALDTLAGGLSGEPDRPRGEFSPYITFAMQVLAFVVVVIIYNQNRSSASKVTWIVLVLFFPVLGLCLYLLVGQPWATRSIRKRFENVDRSLAGRLPQDEAALRALEDKCPVAAGQSRYIRQWGRYPLYRNTHVEFHAQTERAFEALKRELRRAEKFIFMEYHAIELSECFLELESILAERAGGGRGGAPVLRRRGEPEPSSARHFVQRMEALGIHCRVFNPLFQ